MENDHLEDALLFLRTILENIDLSYPVSRHSVVRAIEEIELARALTAPPEGSGRNLAGATPTPDPPSEARAEGRGTYIFLELGDMIEAGDECPSDDCSRWEPVNRWAIGSQRSSIFKIIRRSALTVPSSTAQTGDA